MEFNGFHDFRDSRIEFYDFHDVRYSLMELYDFYDFIDYHMEF